MCMSMCMWVFTRACACGVVPRAALVCALSVSVLFGGCVWWEGRGERGKGEEGRGWEWERVVVVVVVVVLTVELMTCLWRYVITVST